MNKVSTIARKEVAWYFNTPVGYVLLGLFGALANFLALRDIFLRQQADLSGLFTVLPWLLLVFAAAAAARSVAEERKNGTLEVLLSLPITETDIILGKFWGLGMFGLLVLGSTLPTVVIVALLGKPDFGIIFAGYLGGALLVWALLAVGEFISALSTNQAAAVFTALVVFFLLLIIGSPLITDQMPVALRSVFFFVSPAARFESIARGVIELRDVVYFLSLTAGFLYLSVEVLKRRN